MATTAPVDGSGSARITAIILVGGQLLAAAGAVLVNLLAARVLEPAPRGDLAYALQLAYFFSVFAVMGLERPFMAARSGGFNSEYRVFARLILPGVLVTIPFVVLAVAVSPFSSSWLWVGALMTAGYVALNSLLLAVRVAYVASRDWRRFALNAFGSQIVIVAGAVALYLLEVADPVAWMAVYAVSTLPAVLLLVAAIRSGPRPDWPSRPERRTLRRKGFILLPASFSNTAMQRSDRLLLPILGSPAELGLYVTVATVLEMASWPVEQWVDASLRRWAGDVDMPARAILDLLLRSLVLLVGTATALAVATYVMIRFLLPDSYSAATAAIIPLAIASVIYGLSRVLQGVLIAFGAEGRVTTVVIAGTVVAILSYILLIPPYGMLGAAYGSIIGYSACALAAVIAVAGVKRKRDHDIS